MVRHPWGSLPGLQPPDQAAAQRSPDSHPLPLSPSLVSPAHAPVPGMLPHGQEQHPPSSAEIRASPRAGSSPSFQA